MKKKTKRRRGKTIHGTPSAVLLSILIHVALFLLAGTLVIFTVVKQKEVEFESPKMVEQPRMKLKKPKPRLKKSTRPKATSHIVTKVNPVGMPEIQLPDLPSTGLSDALGGGIDGFDLMPDLNNVTVFGSGQTIGNDFEGTLYDLKRRRDGKPLTVLLGPDKFMEKAKAFIDSGWKPSTLARFYRSPKKLYTTTIMIPPTLSYFAPMAFGELEMAPYQFLVHYKGQLVNKEGGRFRFWGMGDSFLVVRVDGEIVLLCDLTTTKDLGGTESKKSGYHLGHFSSHIGKWIDLEPGVPLDMEVLLGERSGGLFGAMLCIEQEGVDYPRNFEQAPLLPIFKTAQLTRDQVDSIFELLPENMCAVTNGPVFSDYTVPERIAPPKEAETAAKMPPKKESESDMRKWVLKDGKTVNAKFVMQFGRKVVLMTPDGKKTKIPVDLFSAEDRDFLELASPPPLKITFLKQTDRFRFEITPDDTSPPPILREITTGARIEKMNMKPYPHELKVEIFSIASEIDGNNYILLDRQEGTFIPSNENGGCYELWGKKAYMKDYQDAPAGPSERRGARFKGHMILVTDQRGKIIAKSVSNDWMLDIVDFLRTFPVGRHFSKEGKRVYPPRGRVLDYFWDFEM